MLSLLLAAACSPAPTRSDSTPLDAVRAFVEAGRSGDHAAAGRCLVAAERRQGLKLDYRDLGHYTLSEGARLANDRMVVTLRCGDVCTPIVAVRTRDGWRVSLASSLEQMRVREARQEQTRPALASAQR